MMTNEEILQRAFDKAIENGWEFPFRNEFRKMAWWFIGCEMTEHIIYFHDFAKAFWGEEKILEEYPLSDGSGEYLKIFMPAWQAHLRKMVLEKNPIAYLEEFV